MLLVLLASSAVAAQSKARTRRVSPRREAAPIRFADVTRVSGIDFHLNCGSLEKRYIMDAMCGGLAVFDYDNDGWIDIYFVDGSTLEDLRAGKCHTGRLYRNKHDGTFADATATAGLDHCGWGFGVAVGDYDNDGWEDLYVTYLDRAVLYHNNRDGTFTDVTAKAGVGNPSRWGTSTAFGDYDRDGHLDLFVANYVDLDLNHLPEFGSSVFCQYRGIPVSCGPRGLKGSRDRLYHNSGDGTFTDVTEQLAIDPEAYYGLGAMWLDFDRDGCADLYVANDSTPSLLYHNDCKGGFTEIGVAAGVAFSADGNPQAGMGVDAADYDHDGLPDIVKTNFSDDTNNLYHNDGDAQFTDLNGPTGFGPVSVPFLGFGIKFADFANRGWKDVFVANGHVNPQVDGHDFGVTYAERPLLFRNLENGKFAEVGLRAGPATQVQRVARGAATADFSNRGSLDVLITQVDGSPVLLRNGTPGRGHWLRVKTVGTQSNRDGFGARVEVRASGMTQSDEVRANSSYVSASDPRLHFGLGAAVWAESVVVYWPSGAVDRIGPQAADQEIVVEEGRGVVVRRKPATGAMTTVSPDKSKKWVHHTP
ncbi:MAG: CRTAC1 family protein [Terriglobales bacterium]